MEFPAVEYTAVSGENNTFKRPRQKMYGVFIISSYIETKGAPIFLNYSNSVAIGNISTTTETVFPVKTGQVIGQAYRVSGFTEEYTPPANMLSITGEVIEKKIINSIDEMTQSVGTDKSAYYHYAIYKASDVKQVTLYSYIPIIRNTGWDLVSTTNDLYQAKEMVNNWLRYPPEIPTTARPRSGMNSVIICEILPADSIVEL